MSSKMSRKEKGFTIIEVVLVLAIAGLIFLMVFIALPALQRAQRDKQRKSDASMIAAAVRNYMKNNHGRAPEDTTLVLETTDNGDGSWTTTHGASDSSGLLAKYLVGIDNAEGGLTRKIQVFDCTRRQETGYSYLISCGITIRADDSMHEAYSSTAWVIEGVQCPAEGNELKMDGSDNDFVLTKNQSDIVVVRYLESGGWTCSQV